MEIETIGEIVTHLNRQDRTLMLRGVYAILQYRGQGGGGVDE